MKKAIAVVLLLAVTAMAQQETPAGRQRMRQAFAGREYWRLAVQAYTFNRVSMLEALEKTKQTGAKYLEAFSWHKIGGAYKDMAFGDASKEGLQAVRDKMKETGVKVIGCYFQEFKDEAAARKAFEFCRDFEIEYTVIEPKAETLPMLEKLAREFRVRVAIHNHPKNPKDEKYTNWDPAAVTKMIGESSRLIGVCADNGHWMRSGLDSVESLRKYEGRVVAMHLKDVNKKGPEAEDVPFGKGIVDLKGILTEVGRQGRPAVFAIEYEANMDNNVADVTACVQAFEKLKAETMPTSRPAGPGGPGGPGRRGGGRGAGAGGGGRGAGSGGGTGAGGGGAAAPGAGQ